MISVWLAAGRGIISFMTTKRKGIIRWRIQQLRRRMGVGVGKRYFFLGAFSYRRKEASTRLRRKPNRLTSAATVPSAFFFLPSISIVLLCKEKEREREEILYLLYFIYMQIYVCIYNFRFRCCDIYFETRRHRREFLDFQKPRIGESSPPLPLQPSSSSPPLSIPPAAEFFFFLLLLSPPPPSPSYSYPVKQVTRLIGQIDR